MLEVNLEIILYINNITTYNQINSIFSAFNLCLTEKNMEGLQDFLFARF